MARVNYKGKSTTVGSSRALRIESAFFRSHPEARGEFDVVPIAPGRFLVSFDAAPEDEGDPALAPFLALLDRDMAENPRAIAPLEEDLMAEIEALVGKP